MHHSRLESFYDCALIYMVWIGSILLVGLSDLTQMVGIGWIFTPSSWVSKIGLAPVCCAHWFPFLRLHVCYNG
jgi:hypothetical protein